MKNAILFLSFLFLAFISCSSTQKTSQNTDWVKLGSKKVDYKLDRDVIRVGLKDGAFTKLKIEATGGAVNMHKLIVEYANGDKENIELRHAFRKGSGSRIIDLKGNKRVIKDITFYYDSKNRNRRRATIHVFGKH